jgi:hypothetical protein
MTLQNAPISTSFHSVEILPNRNPYTRITIVTPSDVYLYSICNSNACAAGGCDYNGNCINGCTNSTPARIGTNCSCPAGYLDNGIDA